MENSEVAALLAETALLMELGGENPFKIRSYRKAADVIEAHDGDLAALHREGRLQSLSGIGKGIAGDLGGLLDEGALAVLEELKARVPPGLVEMTRIRGLGPVRVRAIHQALGVASLGELEYACLENRLASLKGFGLKSQQKLLVEINLLKSYAGRFHIHYALAALDEAAGHLGRTAGVRAAAFSGEARRRLETVGGGALVAAADEPATALDAFLASGAAVEVQERSAALARVALRGGFSVDVAIVPPRDFAARLLWTTGSPGHLAALRARAGDKGLELGEGGLFHGGKRVPADAESAVYEALGLAFIPPELREGAGEVEAAAAGGLPTLVERGDLRGVLHVHTTWSDGSETVATMARAAAEKGFEYLGIADHSRTASYAGGLSIEELHEQGQEIDELNRKGGAFRILHGVESDILPDGSLDYPGEVLENLDFVVASVHSSFHLDREAMTARLVRAVENPATSILGHPTGRLLLGREAYAVDMEAVLAAAARCRVMVEINANPHRLDLDWRWLARCRELGVRVCINPDAHGIPGLDDVDHGLGVARKGWLGRESVANTLPVQDLAALWRKK